MANDNFALIRSMGRGTVIGADRREVDTERLASAHRAEAAIQRALAGPVKQYSAEPDDAQLRAMLGYVRGRIGELKARLADASPESSPA
ncbi:hypothetical protein ACIBG0_25150 [Nocardia sp. NPDC050630]|uniref:hypothetical protein n=1 Tax=Nocardia sp. NPDC050630 TaxID=3364321 RepID=UPI0037AE6F15